MVKIYIFELTPPICSIDKSLILSELDSSELSVFSTQRVENFKLSSIATALAKKIVSIETHIPHKQVLISRTKLGKPIIKRPKDLNFDISISHSGNYCVIGICDSGQIGVDVEILKNIDFKIFKNCLSVSEEKYINSGEEPTRKIENFFEIWTRKEAYLKALGIGLQKPLPITQFYSEQIKPKAEIRHAGKRYHYSTFKEDKFVLSVCTTRSQACYPKYSKLSPDKFRSFESNSKTTSSNF